MRAFAKISLCVVVAGAVAWPALSPSWSKEAGTNLAQVRFAAVKHKKKTRAKPAPKNSATEKPAARQQERTPFTKEDEAAAVIPGIPDARVWGDSESDFQRVLPKASGPWLAISGGGADGAYGAGVINGWTQSGKRPEFAVVTGASIGALIAPYVFLGPRYDQTVRDNLTGITAADVFEDHRTGESLLDSWPLKRMIEKRVTPELLKEIAAEYQKGRRLLVVTTNLDAGRRVIWNMGAIAAKGDDKALKLFRDVLLASSSIPGLFQPVAINVEANGKTFSELHLDGTITAPFFVAPEKSFGPGGSGVPTKQVYVIVNSKLTSEFAMPEHNTVSILGRTIGMALVTGLRTELLLMTVGAQRHDITLNVAHVPESFSQPNRGLFDEKYMRALYELGAKQGQDGSAFESIAPNSAQTHADAPK
jgi:hypothetical protein